MLGLGVKGATRWTAALIFALLGCLTALALASPAIAQNPAAADEYIADGPEFGDKGIANQGLPGEGGPGQSGSDPGSAPGSSSAAELPFTGYPLSTAILVCLALVLAGLLLRLVIAIRDHSRRTSAETPA